MVREFNKVKLKNGDVGYIADKLDDSHFYADVSNSSGEISTVLISINDIESVFVETETPLSKVV